MCRTQFVSNATKPHSLDEFNKFGARDTSEEECSDMFLGPFGYFRRKLTIAIDLKVACVQNDLIDCFCTAVHKFKGIVGTKMSSRNGLTLLHV